jgi:peroxiredoxin
MTIRIGDKIPDVILGVMTDAGPDVISSAKIFDRNKVALFGLPGAFTKTCSSLHLPGFVHYSAALKAKGVDRVICISVNDPWVMDAWGKDQKTENKVEMIADGALNFTKATGLELDLSAKCYGVRCKRFSMIVDDGLVTTLHFEEGDYSETSAERLLKDL